MTNLPPNAAEPCSADWALLTRLFAEAKGSFRHRLGLARSSAADFYAPTGEAEAIRGERRSILASPDAAQYLVDTPEGERALDEFIHWFCPTVGEGSIPAERRKLLETVTLALEPDWLLLASPDWQLVSAGVCFPTRWSLVGKALQPLSHIHAAVPELQEQLGKKIDVFFDRMPPGEGWGRANWGLSGNAERNQHPSLPYTPLSDATALDTVHLRVESQNLCKLPETGAMAFGIRIHHYPLTQIVERPAIAAGLRQQLRTLPQEIALYKGIPGRLWEKI